MQLTEHFALEDLTRSVLAARLGINNTPSSDIIERLHVVATRLEEVRTLLNVPLFITSGYRCPALNAKTPGSALKSAHTLGWAADFHTKEFSPFEVCQRVKQSNIVYDQLIYEYSSWTHLSADPQSRRQVLTKKSGSAYQLGLIGP